MVKLSFEAEIKRETEEIVKELTEHPELETIQMTQEMDVRAKEKFQAYLSSCSIVSVK